MKGKGKSMAFAKAQPARVSGSKFKFSSVLIHFALLVLVIINLFPLYWMIMFSLKSDAEIFGDSSHEQGDTALRAEINWDEFRDAVTASINRSVRDDKAVASKDRNNVKAYMTELADRHWDEIQAQLMAIEDLEGGEKSDDDWNRIREEIDAVVTEALQHAGEAEDSTAHVSPFKLSDNKWQQCQKIIQGIPPKKELTIEKIPPNHIGLPKVPIWSNYKDAWSTGNMGRSFFNSLIVAVFTILVTMLAAFMATYAITRLNWKGRKLMNKFFMLGLTIPNHAALIPVFLILTSLGWTAPRALMIAKIIPSPYLALIIPYSAFSLSMAILISVGFMGDIPYDLDEAAFLDGCGVWGIFFRVIVPLMMPAVATVGIYTFLQCWNELLFALVFVNDPNYSTLPLGLQQFSGQHTNTKWGAVGAALCIATLPTLIVYIALSKKIQAGFIAGAVKG